MSPLSESTALVTVAPTANLFRLRRDYQRFVAEVDALLNPHAAPKDWCHALALLEDGIIRDGNPAALVAFGRWIGCVRASQDSDEPNHFLVTALDDLSSAKFSSTLLAENHIQKLRNLFARIKHEAKTSGTGLPDLIIKAANVDRKDAEKRALIEGVSMLLKFFLSGVGWQIANVLSAELTDNALLQALITGIGDGVGVFIGNFATQLVLMLIGRPKNCSGFFTRSSQLAYVAWETTKDSAMYGLACFATGAAWSYITGDPVDSIAEFMVAALRTGVMTSAMFGFHLSLLRQMRGQASTVGENSDLSVSAWNIPAAEITFMLTGYPGSPFYVDPSSNILLQGTVAGVSTGFGFALSQIVYFCAMRVLSAAAGNHPADAQSLQDALDTLRALPALSEAHQAARPVALPTAGGST